MALITIRIYTTAVQIDSNKFNHFGSIRILYQISDIGVFVRCEALGDIYLLLVSYRPTTKYSIRRGEGALQPSPYRLHPKISLGGQG